jgi:hypothetical protein
LQPEPKTRVMQPQLGFSAHSVSQLQAPPPAFSSQYQPAGQMPPPHKLQVPSSQLGPLDFSGAAACSLASASSSFVAGRLGFFEPSASSADLASALVSVPAPH